MRVNSKFILNVTNKFQTEFILHFTYLVYNSGTSESNSCSFFVLSALYVVDLKKFRKIAAGDRLRGQYQGLSQDPNSLSNLDQVIISFICILPIFCSK